MPLQSLRAYCITAAQNLRRLRQLCGAGPLARGRPPGRPAWTNEEPDQGVRRGRGRPPHVWFEALLLGGAGRYPARDPECTPTTGAGRPCANVHRRVTNPPDPEGAPANLPHEVTGGHSSVRSKCGILRYAHARPTGHWFDTIRWSWPILSRNR